MATVNQPIVDVTGTQYHLIESKTKQLSRANNQHQLGVSEFQKRGLVLSGSLSHRRD
jgi:hypothetical protein